MPTSNSVSYNNNGNIPTPPPLRYFNPSEKQTEKHQAGLTEKQYQQNMAELKGILSQVDSLLAGSKSSPEIVARCQALMGYATAINLPQSRKNQLIGQFPPRVQQMYKQVAKSSEAQSAQRGAIQQAQEVAMAQKHNDIFVQNFNQQFVAGNFSALQGQPPAVWNSCLLNSSINDANSLNVALQNGWDINAKHRNPDGTESTYVEYQGAQIDKGIEGSNKANTTIQRLIGKHPRSKEEEEEYRKAQQAAENQHKNLIGKAQNVANAIKSGKLDSKELAKAQAEMRKIEKRIQVEGQLEQYYRDLASRETDAHKKREYLQRADIHGKQKADFQKITKGEPTQAQATITAKDLTQTKNQHEAYSNIASKNRSDTLKNANPRHQQLNLKQLADSNTIIDEKALNPETRQETQNVISAMSSGKLNPEEMAKAQAEMRKIEKRIQVEGQLEQYYRDLASRETHPHRKQKYLQQAESHSAQADQISEIINPKMPTVEQTIGNDAHTLASGRQPNHSGRSANNTALACMYSHQEDTILSNNQHIAYSNIASKNRSDTLKNAKQKPKPVNLHDLANSNDLVSDMNNLNPTIRESGLNVVNAINSGKLNQEDLAKAQTEMRKIEEYENKQLQLAQEYRDLAIKETNPAKRAELLAQATLHTNTSTQTQQITNKDAPMPTTELSIGKDVHTIASKIASNHNTKALSRSTLADLSDLNKISINDDFMQHISQTVVSKAQENNQSTILNQQETNNNTPISNDFIALLDTTVNANKTQTNQDSLSTKKTITQNHTQNPSAPKLPSLANTTNKSNSAQTTHVNDLDLNTTSTPNLTTQKPSSGLSNAIRLASTSINNIETNQENNMKTLDTSRNA